MKQVIQNFKTGALYVDDVPVPSISKGMVLVENKFSLVSAGTERGTVSMGKSSLIGKAKKRPDLVKQVFANFKKEGFKATFEKVKTKLDSLAALGYSTSGTVIASMDTNQAFHVGDRVACAGQNFASHAEIVSIPQNLMVKIPDNVTFEEASFTTLGAIALQGIRQADPRLGEHICVIGLGLLGQLTCQMLRANGCNVFGIDLSQTTVDLANETNAAQAYNRNDPNLLTAANNFTKGQGFDQVIITAAAPSNDPVELASEISRKKGTIVVVGAVQMDLQRDPYFYRKELELKMSCSYGPGRYDVSYEDEGKDYPYAYVRWTEQRNMEAFLDLIANRVIDINPLITHTFDIADAEKAYDLVLGKVKENYLGILLEYPENAGKHQTSFPNENTPAQKVNCGFIGAGSFAQSYLIPNAKSLASLDTVVTRTGISAKNVSTKFGFNTASTAAEDVLNNEQINTVFIATQHDTHAEYVIRSLQKGKHVFVEKPLAMNMEELEKIEKTCQSHPESLLMVGFNRRFAPISIEAKKAFEHIGEPLVMNFRVNAGFLPKDHWTQTEAGGGRIIGEICHFIDLMQFFADADPVKVYAESIESNNDQIKDDDNLNITIKFSDGSVGNLCYASNGDKGMEKERFEIFGGSVSFVLDNFRGGKLYKRNRVQKVSSSGKGHKQEVEQFLDAVREGKPSPINFRSQYLTTVTTFKILDSLATGLPQVF